MRRAVLFALGLLGASASAADFAPARVDLDAPGALERVRREHPEHLPAITQILREAPAMKPQALQGWIRTAFDGRAPSVLAIKTSYPPQAKLSFTLGKVRYVALVTLENTQAHLHPAVR